jgi:uncharacterized membrane protein YoaK (UPF0700 family)
MKIRLLALPAIPSVLSVTAGYVDTAGFLALHGLFTSHVTGNFVTLGASLSHGSGYTVAKILALPVFCAAVFATRLLRFRFEKSGLPVLGIWLTLQFVLMSVAAAMALHYGPFHDADSLPAVTVGLTLVVAMAVQNAFHRMHLSDYPPTTIMTATTTQAMLDLADLFHGLPAETKPSVETRLTGLIDCILFFCGGVRIVGSRLHARQQLGFCRRTHFERNHDRAVQVNHGYEEGLRKQGCLIASALALNS